MTGDRLPRLDDREPTCAAKGNVTLWSLGFLSTEGVVLSLLVARFLCLDSTS